MTVNDFINQNNGKFLDFDGYYGAQCVDLVQFWSRAIGGPRFSGDAKDIAGQTHNWYAWIGNSTTAVPQGGDIVVWDGGINGGPGHIAIATGTGNTSTFVSFDQNWPTGAAAHLVTHNYNHVAGWLRPPVQVQSQGEDMIHDADNEFARWNKLHLQIRGRYSDRDMFRKAAVGRAWLTAMEILSDSEESDQHVRDANLGALAARDHWDQQIYGLTDQVKALTQLAEDRLKSQAALQKQVDTLTAQVAVQSNDTQLLNNFGKVLLPLLVRLGLKQ